MAGECDGAGAKDAVAGVGMTRPLILAVLLLAGCDQSPATIERTDAIVHIRLVDQINPAGTPLVYELQGRR